jgi:molybdopterin synthase sulfur carrier subunit
MTITVKFFASLRERLGRDGDNVAAAEASTANDVWRLATNDQPLPPNTLIAVNMEYASSDQPVKDGDEVAFFPPVTGGQR